MALIINNYLWHWVYVVYLKWVWFVKGYSMKCVVFEVFTSLFLGKVHVQNCHMSPAQLKELPLFEHVVSQKEPSASGGRTKHRICSMWTITYVPRNFWLGLWVPSAASSLWFSAILSNGPVRTGGSLYIVSVYYKLPALFPLMCGNHKTAFRTTKPGNIHTREAVSKTL